MNLQSMEPPNSNRLRTPPRALLQMDITQRIESSAAASGVPPPQPAPNDPSSRQLLHHPHHQLHPPIPLQVHHQRHVGEAVVRANPRLSSAQWQRHQPPPSHPYPHHYYPPRYRLRAVLPSSNSLDSPGHQPGGGGYYAVAASGERLPRFLSEESLASSMAHGGGLYSSRIHSSADEISSLNPGSPVSGMRADGDVSSMTSDDALSSRDDLDRDAHHQRRPQSHAPWIYPSDIQIDPSSLEASPASEDRPAAVEPAAVNRGRPSNRSNSKQLPSVGQSPPRGEQKPSEFRSEVESELEFEYDEVDASKRNKLSDRLDLPPGVESCRSAMSGSEMDFIDRGESCASFEFLGEKRSRRASALGDESIQEEHDDDDDDDDDDDEDEDEKLFMPKRGKNQTNSYSKEQADILRQIHELNKEIEANDEENSLQRMSSDGGGGSRRSSSSSRPVESRVLLNLQKDIRPPPPIDDDHRDNDDEVEEDDGEQSQARYV